MRKPSPRPWAIPPGTPGLEHRLGGLEKDARTGNVSYDPENHDLMVRTRQAKIDGMVREVPELAVDDPDGAKVLVLGWGFLVRSDHRGRASGPGRGGVGSPRRICGT